MTGLNEIGVPTHFIRRINMREQLVRAVEIIPLEVVVRNIAAGSISKRLGIEEGTPLPRPIVEFYYQERRAERSDGQRGAYPRLRLGHPSGPGRHGRAGAAGE
jgi:phosphoribosylaminoimidazole-succinocarboxamide synthase